MLLFCAPALRGRMIEVVAASATGALRRLRPTDAEALVAHFLRLSPAARRRRFFGPLSDDALRGFVSRIDWDQRIVYGWFRLGVLHAVGEMAFSESATDGEIAFTVEDVYAGRGIGRRLMRRIILAAAARGVRTVQVITESDNIPMRRLADAAGFSLHRCEDGVEGERPLHGGPVTLWLHTVGTVTESMLSAGDALAGSVACDVLVAEASKAA